MWRSAAFSLNLRPQWGHMIRSSASGSGGGGGGRCESDTPFAIALVKLRPCLTAACVARRLIKVAGRGARRREIFGRRRDGRAGLMVRFGGEIEVRRSCKG